MAQDPKATRPETFARLDVNKTNSSTPAEIDSLRGGGFTPNRLFSSKDANRIFDTNGEFSQYRDEREVGVPEVLSTASDFRLTTAQLAYSGSRVSASLDTEPVYVLKGGVRLDFRGQRPGRLGLSVVTFAADEFTWIYVGVIDVGGQDRIDVIFDELGAAGPAAPPPGYSALVRVDTDPTDIVALDYTGTPAHEVVADAVAWKIAQLETELATLKQLVITGVPSTLIGLDVTGAGDATAAQIDGGADTAITAAASGSQPTTITVNTGTGSAGTYTNDDATRATIIATNNDAAGPCLDAKNDILVADNKALSMGASATISTGASSAITLGATSAITMAAGGDIDLTDDTGVIQPGKVAFHSTAAPSGLTGQMMFVGRFITMGIGGDVTKVAIFHEADEPGPVPTGLVKETTGASVEIVMVTGEEVMVELSMEAKQSNVANDVNVQIEANAGVIGTAEPYNGVTNDVYFAVRRVVKYTAVADAPVTFEAFFGASATTSTVQNVHLAVRWSGIA